MCYRRDWASNFSVSQATYRRSMGKNVCCCSSNFCFCFTAIYGGLRGAYVVTTVLVSRLLAHMCLWCMTLSCDKKTSVLQSCYFVCDCMLTFEGQLLVSVSGSVLQQKCSFTDEGSCKLLKCLRWLWNTLSKCEQSQACHANIFHKVCVGVGVWYAEIGPILSSICLISVVCVVYCVRLYCKLVLFCH